MPVQTNSEISQNLKTSTLTTTTTNSNNDNNNGNTNEIAILNSSPLKQLSPSQPLPEVLPTEPDENQPASFEQSQSTKFPIDVIPIQSSHATNESSVLEDQLLLIGHTGANKCLSSMLIHYRVQLVRTLLI